MGPPSKKQEASKKRKLPSPAPLTSKRSKSNKAYSGAKSKPRRQAVDSASLAWTPVGIEDFGDLQFIEGVDVVHDGDKVQFLVPEDNPSKAVADGGDEDDEGGSFEGFGDGPVEGGDLAADQAGHSQAGLDGEQSQEKSAGKDRPVDKKHKKEKQRQKDQGDKPAAAKKKTQESTPRQSGGDNSFRALEALAEAGDEDDAAVDVAAWVPLNLSPRMLSAIAKLGFQEPTAIQERAVPEIVAGEDVIGKAQTGSGKTLAFGIPIVERWLEEDEGPEEEGEEEKKSKRAGPTALVLSPTRELAKQLGDHFKQLCDGLSTAPYVCVVTGGLSIQKQQRQLEKADIVIGTPGRLWEVLDGDMKLQGAFARIKFLVVDEADRLFKVGQFKEAEDIIGALEMRNPEADKDEEEEEDDLAGRQTLVFSATFDKGLQTKLAGKGKLVAGSDEEKMSYLMKCLKFRRTPKFIDVNPVTQMAEKLKEGLIECGAMEKDLYLYSVLLLNPNRRTLVFTNSISAVRRLAPLLQNLNLAALPLHSQMAQKARLRSLERFTASESSILIATDVAARGLDIKNVEQVLHYHVPRSADTYIHRSGRTARGDRSGVSVILCSPEEVVPAARLATKVHASRRVARLGKRDHAIQTLPLDRKIAARLKPRVDMAKRLADAVLAKEKGHSDEAWLRGAAEELGVDYDPEAMAASERGGRGGGRKRKEGEARAMSKAEMGALRAGLREELARRLNLGVSERYITGGRVDVAQLLREREQKTVGGLFLGGEGLGLKF